jgi:hypothetical protein
LIKTEKSGKTALVIAGPVFAASCVCVFLFFWLGAALVANPHGELTLQLPGWDQAKWWLGRPDTAYYIGIVRDGYKAARYSSREAANWAFFPAYPILVRLLADGRAPEFLLAVGFGLSLSFYACGTWLLGRLLLLDFDTETVTRTLLLFCFYPLAFSLGIFGPDSLLFLAASAAFYCARKGRWPMAALATGIASITRVQGVLVLPCLLYMCWRSRPKIDRRFAWLAVAPLGLAAFAWHLWRLTGNPLAFVGIQRAWNNSPSYPFAFLVDFLRSPKLIGSDGWDPTVLTVAVTCGATGLALWSWRRRQMPLEYCLFFALQVVVLTCRSSAMGNLRYATGCFPFFLALGITSKRTVIFGVLLAVFAGFLGLMAALFGAGHHTGYFFAAF